MPMENCVENASLTKNTDKSATTFGKGLEKSKLENETEIFEILSSSKELSNTSHYQRDAGAVLLCVRLLVRLGTKHA